MNAATKTDQDLGWALVKPSITSIDYMPVRVVRKGKRFAYVVTPKGDEWRYTARGLWDGFATEDDAYAELAKMRASVRFSVSPYMARRGYTKFVRGCWTEDGDMAGSGYGLTTIGRAALEDKP